MSTRYRVCGPTLAGGYYIERNIHDELGIHGWKRIKIGFFLQVTAAFDTFDDAKSFVTKLVKKDRIELEKKKEFKKVEIPV